MTLLFFMMVTGNFVFGIWS